MARQWYIRRGDKQHGPVSEARLRQLSADGKLSPTDMVRSDNSTDWTPVPQVNWLSPQIPVPPPLPTSEPPIKQGPPETEEGFFQQASKLAGQVGAGAVQTGKLAAKQAEKAKLTTFTLPNAYAQLPGPMSS